MPPQERLQIKPLGLTLKIANQVNGLQVSLVSERGPISQSLVPLIQQQLVAKGFTANQPIQICGWQAGHSSPDWCQDIGPEELAAPDLPQVLKRARQGNLEAIATWLNQVLQPQQVKANVGMRRVDHLLYITLDGATIPEAASLLPLLQAQLEALALPDIHLVRVYGRQAGVKLPTWQQDLPFPEADGNAEANAETGVTLPPPAEQPAIPVTATAPVVVQIEGGVSGQVAIGSNIRQESYTYQIHASHGGVVNFAPPPRIQPRPTPVSLRPRPFANLLDRRDETRMAIATLSQSLPVEFHASAGMGKSALMAHLAYDPEATAPFPDGVIHLPAHHQPADDLLQALYEGFYTSDVPFKPTPVQLRHALQDRRALVLLDDLNLPRDEVDRLLDAAPSSSFLLTSAERCLWSNGHAMPLAGLPLADALALVEREFGRPLTPEERLEAEALCTALAGHPLRVQQAIALAQEQNESLGAIAQQMQTGNPDVWLLQHLLPRLSQAHRWILALLAALGGIALLAEQAGAMTTIPNPTTVLDTLQRLHLVQVEGARYRLSGNLIQALQQHVNVTPWLERAIAYVTHWAEQTLPWPDRLRSEADVVLHLLEWAERTGQWQQVMQLGRLVEGSLALGQQWGRWEQVLQHCYRAAQALGDEPATAWALHQLGTRALCLEQTTLAQQALTQALHLREALGDEAGAAVTRHNLQILLGPSSTPEEEPLPAATREQGWWVRGAIALTVATASGVGIWLGLQPRISQADLEIIPNRLEFEAPQMVGEASLPQAVVLTNTSARNLEIEALQIEGANPDDFAITSDTCSETVLPRTNHCTVEIQFQPTAPNQRQAALLIPYGGSDQDDSPLRLPLSGRGTLQPVPFVQASPERLAFGEQLIATPSSTQTVTFTNTGTAPLEFGVIERSGNAADDFDILQETCAEVSLPPAGNCFVEISFRPTATGERTASLDIQHNAADAPRRWALSGVGVPSPTANPAQILRFQAEPDRIISGNETELCYGVEGATSAQIQPGIGTVDPVTENCIPVSPSATTTYTLTATNPDGESIDRQSTIEVVARPARILRFQANPARILTGDRTQLCYGVEGATSTQIQPGIGTVDPVAENCIPVSPSATATYTLTATNPDGESIDRQTTVEVAARPARILRFQANPDQIISGNETRLCYGVAEAASARIEPNIGTVDPVAENCISVTPTATTTYTLTATSTAGQSVRATASVTVVAEPPQIFFFNVAYLGDGIANFCYGVRNAVQATIEPDIGPVPTTQQDCIAKTLGRAQTFTLTATNASGNSVQRQAEITYPTPTPVPTTIFSPNPEVFQGPR